MFFFRNGKKQPHIFPRKTSTKTPQRLFGWLPIGTCRSGELARSRWHWFNQVQGSKIYGNQKNKTHTVDDAKLKYASVGLLVDKLPIISERVFKSVFIHPKSVVGLRIFEKPYENRLNHPTESPKMWAESGWVKSMSAYESFTAEVCPWSPSMKKNRWWHHLHHRFF